MAKREKRTSRFSQLKTYYDMYEQGMLTEETAKTHIQFAKENNGTVIFESEFAKFAEEYKDDVTSGKLDIEKFKNFCAATGALKKAGKKSSTGGDINTNRRLNTPEAAIARGVVPEKIDAYIEGVNAIYAVSKVINALLTNARVSFAIPIEHPKTEQVVETP